MKLLYTSASRLLGNERLGVDNAVDCLNFFDNRDLRGRIQGSYEQFNPLFMW